MAQQTRLSVKRRRIYITMEWQCVHVIFIVCGLIVCANTSDMSDSGKGENNGCSSVKLAWGTKGFDTQMVPQSPTSGDQLQICVHRGSSCCTRQMEIKLSTQASNTLNRNVSDKIGLVREALSSRTVQFHDFCHNLINKSGQDLHTMFTRTYGMMYEQNTVIFSDLFRNLMSYFNGGNNDLSETMDSFFSRLMVRMFTLYNIQYAFNEQYLVCIDEHIGNLSPLGDVPQQLGVQVKRAFVAARTFYQGLVVGRDAVTAIMRLEPSHSCVNAVTRMLYCPYCRGHVPADLKPCNALCMNVMRGCLVQHHELNEAWNSYVDAMHKVAGRLEGPFNIESVIGPINVKISDAIMNFQENSAGVTEKVFHMCGTPPLQNTRAKRNTAAAQSGRRRANHDDVRSSSNAELGIDSLIRDIRDRLQDTHNFWKAIPDTVCNSMAAPPTEVSNCWNGVNVSRYAVNVVDGGLRNQVNNSEVYVDRLSSVVSQQLQQLRTITNKLTNAHKGLDVDWLETVDDESESEGSASGDDPDDPYSGSGDGYIDNIDNIVIGRSQPTRDYGLSFTLPTHPPVEVVTRGRPAVVETHRPPSRLTTRPTLTSSAARATELTSRILLLTMAMIWLRTFW